MAALQVAGACRIGDIPTGLLCLMLFRLVLNSWCPSRSLARSGNLRMSSIWSGGAPLGPGGGYQVPALPTTTHPPPNPRRIRAPRSTGYDLSLERAPPTRVTTALTSLNRIEQRSPNYWMIPPKSFQCGDFALLFPGSGSPPAIPYLSIVSPSALTLLPRC